MARGLAGAIATISFVAFFTIANGLPSATNVGPYGYHRHSDSCGDVNGTITINQLGLYPENADFDFHSCLLYIGVLFNASVARYDPYKRTTEIFEFQNISHNPEYHLGGVAANPHTNLISIVVDAGAAFNTGGKDISGTNLVLLWDPVAKKELYRLNLTETTHGTYGGFQDVEFDKRGNVYVVGTFPSSIVRIENNGTKINEWYKSNANHTVSGYAGLAVTGDVLLSNDNAAGANGSLVRFDLTAEKGTPVVVPISPSRPISGSDAIYLPPKYNGTVLLVAVDASGVEVFRSKDAKWSSAEALGQVSNKVPAANGAFVTGAVQIGSGIYMIEEFFTDAQPGNRTAFPFVDITAEVDKLAKAQ